MGGLAVLGFGISPIRGARTAAPHVIEMRSNALGSRVWYDPIGLYVEPGTIVRWIARENVHTATAYHPRNGNHALRIPERAVPWNSGFLVNPGDHFDVTLSVPGVYDYFCMPHEAAAVVSLIVDLGAPGERLPEQASIELEGVTLPNLVVPPAADPLPLVLARLDRAA